MWASPNVTGTLPAPAGTLRVDADRNFPSASKYVELGKDYRFPRGVDDIGFHGVERERRLAGDIRLDLKRHAGKYKLRIGLDGVRVGADGTDRDKAVFGTVARGNPIVKAPGKRAGNLIWATLERLRARVGRDFGRVIIEFRGEAGDIDRRGGIVSESNRQHENIPRGKVADFRGGIGVKRGSRRGALYFADGQLTAAVRRANGKHRQHRECRQRQQNA